MEIASKSTKAEDAPQRALHARLGIAECGQYEPPGERLPPGLECRRWVKDRYVRVLPPRYRRVVDMEACLGRGLGSTGELRLWDPARKEWFPTHIEAAAQRIQAEPELAQIQRPIDRLEAEVHLRQARLAEMDPDAAAQCAVQSLDQIASIF